MADRALLSTAVMEAGKIALSHFRHDPRQWYKGPGQIVTEADIEVDRYLYDLLIGARPEDGWLSEERDEDGSRHRCRRVWMIDPIDGTRSFAEGVPEFTISIALLIDDQPVLASILNPATGEHFEATVGEGALLNGQPISPSLHGDIAGAPLLASKGEMKKRHWPALMPDADFTTIGSLAYKLALVAAGRFAGLISRRSSYDWDLAAAVLLIREASGWLSDAEGRPLHLNGSTLRHPGLVAAGNKALYSQLLGRLETIESS